MVQIECFTLWSSLHLRVWTPDQEPLTVTLLVINFYNQADFYARNSRKIDLCHERLSLGIPVFVEPHQFQEITVVFLIYLSILLMGVINGLKPPI